MKTIIYAFLSCLFLSAISFFFTPHKIEVNLFFSLGYFLLYFILSVIFLNAKKKDIEVIHILPAFLIGSCILETPLLLFYFYQYQYLLFLLVGRFLGIGGGYLFYKSKNRYSRCGSILLFIILIGGVSFIGNYNDLTLVAGRLETPIKVDVMIQTRKDNILNLTEEKGKILCLFVTESDNALDLFPDLKKLCERYHQYSYISFWCVYTNNKNNIIEDLRKQNSFFSTGFISPHDSVLKHLAYLPDITITNIEGEIVFRGSINIAEKILESTVVHMEK